MLTGGTAGKGKPCANDQWLREYPPLGVPVIWVSILQVLPVDESEYPTFSVAPP